MSKNQEQMQQEYLQSFKNLIGLPLSHHIKNEYKEEWDADLFTPRPLFGPVELMVNGWLSYRIKKEQPVISGTIVFYARGKRLEKLNNYSPILHCSYDKNKNNWKEWEWMIDEFDEYESIDFYGVTPEGEKHGKLSWNTGDQLLDLIKEQFKIPFRELNQTEHFWKAASYKILPLNIQLEVRVPLANKGYWLVAIYILNNPTGFIYNEGDWMAFEIKKDEKGWDYLGFKELFWWNTASEKYI